MVSLINDINLELAVSQMPEYLILLNTRGEIIFFNKEAERLHREANRPIELGIPFIDALDTSRSNFFLNTLEELKAGKQNLSSETSFKDASGSVYNFEVIYSSILESNGDVGKICVIAREITPQKIYEKKTNQLIHELSNLIDDANAIIFGVDSLGSITDWNKESVRTTQFDKGEVFTLQLSSFIDESTHNEFDELLNRALNGESVSNQELHIKTKNSMFTALVNATPKKNGNGQVIGVLFVGQDITELANYRQSLERMVEERTESLKKALKKEQELVDLKNKFVSIASHEFKLPLSSIGTSIHQMKSNQRLRKTDQDQLTNMERQIQIMRVLLEDVLTVEKSESNKLKANLQKIDLVAFLKRTASEIAQGTGQTHKIMTDFSHQQLYLNSDEKLLRNIFSNLLSNAIKFSPSKDSIFLSLKGDRSSVEVSVRDQGIGIGPEDLKRVFEPFNRGSNVNEIKGTGLGLSIVKKATEALSGTLEVDSEIEKGTTFRVRFKID